MRSYGEFRRFFQRRKGVGVFLLYLLIIFESHGKFENFFSEREISIKTPAFQGEQIEITDSEKMFKYIAGVAKENISVDFFTIGKSPLGRNIPYLMITEKGAINQGYDPKKLTIWIQAMQHGDEHGAGEAALNIIGYLATDEGKNLLKDLNVIVVPRANMDGGEIGERFNNGKDMNMDHIRLSLPETQGIKRGVLKYEPEIFLDLHEYPSALSSFSQLPGRTILPFYDILTYKSVNMNTVPEISDLADEILGNLKRDLNRERISTNFYYNNLKKHEENITLELPTGQSGAFRNAYGIFSGVSILIEGRGRGMGVENYSRRVENLADSVKSVMRYAAREKNRIKVLVKNVKERNRTAAPGDLYLRGGEITTEGEYKFIRVDEEQVGDFSVTLHTTTDERGAVIRGIPEGYILSGEESGARELLNLHGISYEIISQKTPMRLEEYRKIGERYALVEVERDVAAGSILVSTKQVQKTVVALLFEPDGLESFVAHGIIDGDRNKLPISRVISPVKVF